MTQVSTAVLLKIEQVCELEGWKSERHVRRVAKAEAWPTQESPARGRNGKREQLFFLSSLSAQAQIKHARGGIAPSERCPAPETMPLFSSEPAPFGAAQDKREESAARTSIPEELRPQAEQRFAAIEPLLKFRDGNARKIELPGGRVVSKQSELAAWIGAQQQPAVSTRTIFRWLDRWDAAVDKGENGYLAIVRSPRNDAFGPGSRSMSGEAQMYVRKKYLDCREGELGMYQTWQILVRDWSTILRQKGEPPSYPTVRAYLNQQVGLGEKTLARVGPEAHLARCAPFILRSKTPVMQTWISDHRKHDVLVQNFLFAMKREQIAAGYRVWLTAVADMGSQAIVGYCFSSQPNWKTIHSAIRMAVMQYGFPREFYWDNGEDYKKVKRNLERIEITKEVLGFDFRVTSAIPKRPRSKPIESFFTRFSRRFDPMWGHGYLGNNPQNRREYADRAQYLHRRYLEAKAVHSPLPSDVEFIAGAIQWIHEYNNTRWPSLKGKTPNELMEEAWPERNRPKINPRALDLLLWEPTMCTVRNGGSVRMDKMWYEPVNSSLYALSRLQGQKVLVLRDPYDLGGGAVAVTENRAFIGELQLKQFIDQDIANPITRDQLTAELKQQRELKKMDSQPLASLALYSRHRGWTTERERLLQDAGVMTGTDGRVGLPQGAIPGARALPPPARTPVATASAFVSDDVAKHGAMFENLVAEEE